MSRCCCCCCYKLPDKKRTCGLFYVYFDPSIVRCITTRVGAVSNRAPSATRFLLPNLPNPLTAMLPRFR